MDMMQKMRLGNNAYVTKSIDNTFSIIDVATQKEQVQYPMARAPMV